jgi:hypothetical protein
MLKLVKYAIITNIALSLVFVLSNYSIWANVNKWTHWNIASTWSPIRIEAYRIPDMPTVLMPVGPLWNLPFLLFWVMLIVNLYVIFKMQKSK